MRWGAAPSAPAAGADMVTDVYREVLTVGPAVLSRPGGPGHSRTALPDSRTLGQKAAPSVHGTQALLNPDDKLRDVPLPHDTGPEGKASTHRQTGPTAGLPLGEQISVHPTHPWSPRAYTFPTEWFMSYFSFQPLYSPLELPCSSCATCGKLKLGELLAPNSTAN